MEECAFTNCTSLFVSRSSRHKYCSEIICKRKRASAAQSEFVKKHPEVVKKRQKYFRSERFAEVRRNGYLRRLARDPELQAAVESYKSGLGYFACAKKHSIPRDRVASTIRALGIQRSHNASVKKSKEESTSRRNNSYPSRFIFRRWRAKTIYETAKGVCEYCREPVSPYAREEGYKDWTCHHMMPVSRDQSKALDTANGALLHKKCHKDNTHELHGFGSFNIEETNSPQINGFYVCWTPVS